jgi:hypothetical protein
MAVYKISSVTMRGEAAGHTMSFEDDDAAIAYALPLARGNLIEVWRGGRLIATVDERPCLVRLDHAA